MSVCMCVCFQAYSLVDREVGYCQGSAFIVGLLLMQVMIKELKKMVHKRFIMRILFLKIQYNMSELHWNQSQ